MWHLYNSLILSNFPLTLIISLLPLHHYSFNWFELFGNILKWHMHVCVPLYVYLCTWLCICMYVCLCMCICPYVYVCVCVYVYERVCRCIRKWNEILIKKSSNLITKLLYVLLCWWQYWIKHYGISIFQYDRTDNYDNNI